MSKYYQYLTQVKSSTIITADYWNALVASNQASDDLLYGSLFPFATQTIPSGALPNFVTLNTSFSFIRYYTAAGVVYNSENTIPMQPSSNSSWGLINTSWSTHRGQIYAFKVILPGFYAWNINWGEDWDGVYGDQMIAVTVRKIKDSELNTTAPYLATVIGQHGALVTSWRLPTTDRYNQTSSFYGMGYPLHSHSGIHYFNAPPYATEYEYLLIEFASSARSRALATSFFYNFKEPTITVMKVR